MSNYKAVAFDLGGVVVGSMVPHFLEYTQQVLGVPLPQLVEALDLYRPAMERGETSPQQFWRQLTAKLGIKYEPDKDLQLWTAGYLENSPVRTEILDLADRLRTNGYKVGMLSNTTAEHVAINLGRHIFEHFDPALMSNQLGARKPEAAAFQALLAKLGTKPEETIFIDDLEENVAGAEAVGIKAIKFAGYSPLVDELKRLGVNTD